MSKILTKAVQNKISRYFIKIGEKLSKAETRCVREMAIGILIKGTVLVNKVASGIKDDVSLSKTTKRFRTHYNKDGFSEKIYSSHFESVKGKVCHGDYVAYDGSDIQKKYAKFMEGLDYVKDGSSNSIGLGYWLMDAMHISKEGSLTPLMNRLYSFNRGAKSENLEVISAVKNVKSAFDKKLTHLFDRGMDRPVCRDEIISQDDCFVLRMNAKTKLIFKGTETAVNKISKAVPLFMKLSAVKIKKNRREIRNFMCGAIKVKYEAKGKEYELWLVVTKRENGGYCWLLTRSPKQGITEIIREAFTAYGYRWKIEEFHRHVKSCYRLEDIQIKTFEGLKSMLAILTVAMSLIYRSIEPLHQKLILDSGIKTCNKEKLYELYNFIYYKISSIIETMFAQLKPRAFLPIVEPHASDGQLRLALNFDD